MNVCTRRHGRKKTPARTKTVSIPSSSSKKDGESGRTMCMMVGCCDIMAHSQMSAQPCGGSCSVYAHAVCRHTRNPGEDMRNEREGEGDKSSRVYVCVWGTCLGAVVAVGHVHTHAVLTCVLCAQTERQRDRKG